MTSNSTGFSLTVLSLVDFSKCLNSRVFFWRTWQQYGWRHAYSLLLMQEGGRADLHCRVEGLRSFTVSWLRDSACTQSYSRSTLVQSLLWLYYIDSMHSGTPPLTIMQPWFWRGKPACTVVLYVTSPLSHPTTGSLYSIMLTRSQISCIYPCG
jgi:hypothetical protein